MRSCFALMLLLCPAIFGSTIHVPQDQPTIQAGINAAQNDDIVLVSPGIYSENIDFMGKAITVRSSNGPSVTKIANSTGGITVTFDSGENATSVLEGFAITGGMQTTGIYIVGSPTITNNIITGNHSCDGAGIDVDHGSPIIKGNVISNNFHDQCSGGIGGAGIAVVGGESTEIVGNLIFGNDGGNGAAGGGISLDGAGAILMDNVVVGNTIEGPGGGGGIGFFNFSSVVLVQNLVVDNVAGQGGGIYFTVPEGSQGPILVNNTIVGADDVSEGSAVWAGGFDSGSQFFNNIMVGLSGQNAVWCDNTYSQQPPSFMNNDAWSAKGSGLQGTCESQSQQNGNISANPLFVNPFKRNFQLQAKSPAINAGDNSAPDLPSKDLAGHSRIVGGTIDMGAYEYQSSDAIQ